MFHCVLSRPLAGRLLLVALLSSTLTACNTSAHLSIDRPIVVSLDKPIQVHIDNGIPYRGTYVSPEQMELITPGSTTTDYVLAVLGEPDQRATLNDKSEIWKWNYQPLEETAPVVTIIKQNAGTTAPAVHVLAFVRVAKGIVVQKFRG